MKFVATYPATLLYALDGAAGLRNHDPGYRAWLVGNERPGWLADYAAHRDSWQGVVRDDAGGGAPTFDVCGWTTQTLEETRKCLDDVVPWTEHAILEKALDEADQRLSPKWPAIEAHLTSLTAELARSLATQTAGELFQKLRREASLSDDTPLRFNVVVVGKPPSNHSYARQVGGYLVHEAGGDETSGGLLGVAFHEMAHLAHHMSPERPALDRSFLALGDSGRLAANVWDEVVATAFGNGLAAEAFDPAFRVGESFYADEHLDAVGRALYLEWKAGLDVRLGPSLAKDLTRLVDANWSPDERPVGRYLWYVAISAEAQSTLAGALDGIDARSAYRTQPIDDAMAAPSGLPPWAPRVVLATVDELVAHRNLVARTGIPEGSWTSAVDAHRAAAFRRTDPDGTLLFVIVAKDPESLGKAMPDFARLGHMVEDGWTSW
jgi:hypothetical protein